MKTLITVSNTKLGGHIAQLNFPPGATCRPDAPCKKDCWNMAAGDNVKFRKH